MYLEKLLLSKHAKSTTNNVINWVENDPVRFKTLMQLVLGNDQLLAQRAAWAMSYIVIEHPTLIYPYINKLLDAIQKPVHPALKRNTFRFLKEIEIPKKNMTKVIDASLAIVNNPKEPIAVICFAFYTLISLLKSIPELRNEVLFATELHIDNEASGLKNTIKKVRKELLKG